MQGVLLFCNTPYNLLCAATRISAPVKLGDLATVIQTNENAI